MLFEADTLCCSIINYFFTVISISYPAKFNSIFEIFFKKILQSLQSHITKVISYNVSLNKDKLRDFITFTENCCLLKYSTYM